MTIEQKPELNRFIDPSIPITWQWRWRIFKIISPIWILILVCYFEMGITSAWFRDRLTWSFLATLILGFEILFIFIWSIGELQIRLQHRSKRLLKIEDKRIVVRPAKNSFILWKRVSKFQFEPLVEMPGMTTLKIFLNPLPKRKNISRVFWKMVIEPTQSRRNYSCVGSKKTGLSIKL